MKNETPNTANTIEKLKAFRKELRKNLTPAEAKLWDYLRNKQLDGRKFRRQHSVGNYILDFYCHSEKLAIELDGQSHHSQHAKQYDQNRDDFLRNQGIKVLRFENKIVFLNSVGVLGKIRAEFKKSESITPPALRATLR